MYRKAWVPAPAALGRVVLLTPAVQAGKERVKPTREWSGSVDDEALKKDAAPVLTDRKQLEKLWKAWGIAGQVPDVDFSREVVVVSTTSGSRLRLAATLDDKGNLQVLGMATLDFRPGFRYAIATVPRKGVKTVNGKALPDTAGAQGPR